jgi:hypothetical protein
LGVRIARERGQNETQSRGKAAGDAKKSSHWPWAVRVAALVMPKRPSRKKNVTPAKPPGPQDVQAGTDRRTAEQLRERQVRHLLGKYQGRKSI